MLRIRFSFEDVSRVTVARHAHPSWELMLSINSLQAARLPSRFAGWRRDVLRTGTDDRAYAGAIRAAATLAPPGSNFPDFLTPQLEDPAPQAHLEAMLGYGKAALRKDLARTFRRQRVPTWANGLYERGNAKGTVEMLRQYYDLAIAPRWPRIHQAIETDRAMRSTQLTDNGVGAVLSSLHPSIRWRAPVLETDYPFDHDLDLAGRGLVLQPAYFCWGSPITLIDTDRSPVLVYPAAADDAIPQPRQGEERLGKLLGGTRARLLELLTLPTSTGRLAVRLDVSSAAISQHTAVLRGAGLVATNRLGQSVQHTLTPLGRELLRAS
ncbi:ArsR/SmtB family transcription factor [Tenggerimyces flavus]|uniref:ArsR/SmtB family transcription factor n=1 Tax=Tenggerimyces flavus TaxID=1708749 RepID=A0ABV7YGH1_9ACTN|nr:winged helix-turn-helix domain-containing protein [Tenggerimyces flavus]MBM7783896.1 DNA-binding transcriptional ArsR family regulator [Tenggerimyces flavus]